MAFKYTTLDALKAYGQVTATKDDNVLNEAIYRAEAAIDQKCGSAFDQQTVVDELAHTCWVDGKGWLVMTADERGPVTAVTSISVRDLLNAPTAWQSVSWASTDIILPPITAPIRPDAWKVRIYPATPLWPRATGQIYAKWTYIGGYATIPTSLISIANRLAWWYYKLREAPMGRVVTAELGLMEIPLSVPPDIKADLMLWTRMT
jgi:hypothetical protein